MKIVLISSSYHPYYRGGGEYSVKALAENLLRLGHEVRVIAAYEREQTDIIAGITVHRIKHPNIYWSYHLSDQSAGQKLIWHALEGYNPRVASSVAPILTKYRPDILHIRNVEDFSPYVTKVAHQLGIPVVVTLNSYTWLCPKATMFRAGHNCPRQCRDCQLMTYPKKRLSRYVDVAVGVSQFMVDTHRAADYFPQALTSVIYTLVEPKFPITQPRQPIRFGYIGRVHPTKGVFEVIQAFRSLAPGPELYIAGEGPEDYVRHCRQAAEGDQRIHFLGKVAASHFYEQVDVVMVSSLWNEPFPRVLVEAYAYGKPVIAARTGGTPEKVIPHRTGYLYNPDDNQALVEQMRIFAQMSEVELRAMQLLVTDYLQEFLDEGQQYAQLYQSLIK